MCLYSCASRWEPWFTANLAIREPEHWLLALETILCTACFLARGRGSGSFPTLGVTRLRTTVAPAPARAANHQPQHGD